MKLKLLIGDMKTLKEEVKLRRPSIIATLLWAFGIFIIGLTVARTHGTKAIVLK